MISRAYLEMRHKMCTVSLDLLVGRNGTEDDLRELPAMERSVGDTPDVALVSCDRIGKR